MPKTQLKVYVSRTAHALLRRHAELSGAPMSQTVEELIEDVVAREVDEMEKGDRQDV